MIEGPSSRSWGWFLAQKHVFTSDGVGQLPKPRFRSFRRTTTRAAEPLNALSSDCNELNPLARNDVSLDGDLIQNVSASQQWNASLGRTSRTSLDHRPAQPVSRTGACLSKSSLMRPFMRLFEHVDGEKPLGNPNNKASHGRSAGWCEQWRNAGFAPVGFVIHHRAGPRAFGLSGASPDG